MSNPLNAPSEYYALILEQLAAEKTRLLVKKMREWRK